MKKKSKAKAILFFIPSALLFVSIGLSMVESQYDFETVIFSIQLLVAMWLLLLSHIIINPKPAQKDLEASKKVKTI